MQDAIICVSGPLFEKEEKIMSKKDSKNSKLTINDRMLIQARIAKGEPATLITEGIEFSASAVYRVLNEVHFVSESLQILG